MSHASPPLSSDQQSAHAPTSKGWSVGRSLLLLFISFDLAVVIVWLVVYYEYYEAVATVVGGVWGVVVTFLTYVKVKTRKTMTLPEFLGHLPVKMIIVAYTVIIVVFMSFYLLAQFPVHTVQVTATLNGHVQSGVEIFWDGARKGKTNEDGQLKISTVKRGHHDLRAVLEGFPEETIEDIFVGMGLKLHKRVRFDRSEILRGNVFVDSDPPGAHIAIDGERREGLRTPVLIYDLSARVHDVILSRTGYHSHEQPIRIRAGGTDSIFVRLLPQTLPAPPTGAVRIESDPSGAEIYLDGEKIKNKRTPILIPGLSLGSHYLELRKLHEERERYGYVADEREIEIHAADTSILNVDLRITELCELTIYSDPDRADIHINDEEHPRGTAPLTLRLFPGTCQVRVCKEDYKEQVRQVTLRQVRGNLERFTLVRQ